MPSLLRVAVSGEGVGEAWGRGGFGRLGALDAGRLGGVGRGEAWGLGTLWALWTLGTLGTRIDQ